MSTTHRFNIQNKGVTTTVISTEAELDQCLSNFLATISRETKAKRVVGLNVEKMYENIIVAFNQHKVREKAAILTLCFGTTCLIIKLLGMRLASLSQFLQVPELSFVGVGIRHCVEALQRDYGIKCRNAVDLAQLAAAVREAEKFRAYGLVDLADMLCLFEVNKMMNNFTIAGLSNWGAPTLSHQQVEAATRSAFSCFCIGHRLFGGLF